MDRYIYDEFIKPRNLALSLSMTYRGADLPDDGMEKEFNIIINEA